MKRKDVITGVIVLALLAGFLYYRQKNQKVTPTVSETVSTEKTLEDKFKIEIPEDVDKAELKDVSGGSSSGIVTKDFSDAKFTSSVLVDLPTLNNGEYYQAWLVKGDVGAKDYSLIRLGTLKSAKGGYLLDFSGKTDYSDYNKVIVTKEIKLDGTPETTVLEGSF